MTAIRIKMFWLKVWYQQLLLRWYDEGLCAENEIELVEELEEWKVYRIRIVDRAYRILLFSKDLLKRISKKIKKTIRRAKMKYSEVRLKEVLELLEMEEEQEKMYEERLAIQAEEEKMFEEYLALQNEEQIEEYLAMEAEEEKMIEEYLAMRDKVENLAE